MVPSDEPAKQLFRQLLAGPDPFASIRDQCLGGHLRESETLEVKRGVSERGDTLRNWSKALSAFSNSSGGVFLCGFEADNNSITALSLVPNIHHLRAMLLQQLPNAIEPSVTGVQVEAVPSPDSDQGFVVAFIPSSPWRPHRARQCNDKYYVRSGDNSAEAGPSLLRMLFHPVSVARFGMTGRIRKTPNRQLTDFRLVCFLHLEGPATAYDTFIIPGWGRDDPEPKFSAKGWTAHPSAMGRLAFQAQRPLHPGETIELFTADLGSLNEGIQQISELPTPTYKLRIHAANQPPTIFKKAINVQEDIKNDFAFDRLAQFA